MKRIFIVISFLLLTLFSLCSLQGCKSPKENKRTVKYESIEDFRGGNIGTLTGSSYEKMLHEKFDDTNIMLIDAEADLIQALLSRQADAIVIDGHSLNYYLDGVKGINHLEEPFMILDVGMAFNLETGSELRDQFNEFLAKIRKDGTYAEIYEKWVINCHTSNSIDVPKITEGEPLKVAIPGTVPPMSFIKNGNVVGFDVEIISRFANYINRPVEFTTMNFSALIPSLVSGRHDVVAASLNITPERLESVLFSDPYFLCEAAVAYCDHEKISKENESGFLGGIINSFKRNIVEEKRYVMILDGLMMTIIIALFSIFLGTMLGALICWMKMSSFKSLKIVADLYISLMRGMPVLVLLMLMFYVVFAGTRISATTVAVITFAMNFAAYVSEMFRTSIESIDNGQSEAGIALGFTPLQTFKNIVLPQALKIVLPVYKGEVISLVKMTSIVGYIAIQDLTKVGDIIRSRTFDAFFPLIIVAVLYFILAWIFTFILDQIGKKLINV